MVDKSHIRRMLEFQTGQANALARRPGTEIAPGLWSDPLSEARHDYGGEQSAYEAALMQIKTVHDAIEGVTGFDVDIIWDTALQIAAHIVESDTEISADNRKRLGKAIRALKKQ